MTVRPNPYVGPRAFDVGAPIYGRARELRQLKSLLVAERIVLLYSPSGAGKTSLIQAGLIPSLPKNFNILPIIRVNLEPPDDLRDIAGFNRYIFSTLIALEDAQPVELRLPVADLATLGLDTYIEQRLPLRDMVLIFDQFEEILTVSPVERDAKIAFFDALGVALRNPDCWALFSMREDFIGALDPYLRPIPGQMESRYRLDLLKSDAAREAIQSPPRQQGISFTRAAAEKLVRDLSRIQIQNIKGETHEEQGEYVEPVQLQVVCFSLWQNLSDDTTEIDETDLAEVGSVDESLAGYYASIVANVAATTGTSERDLRTWFDSKLLLTGPANQPVRGQVRKGPNSTEGLVNTALDELVNAHIIRAESRAGAMWYELAHDRLLDPVHSNNQSWFDANLKFFQRQALLWDQQGRGEGLLLRGKELELAENEAKILKLPPHEDDFLETCRRLRKREQQERRNNQIKTFFAILATIAMMLAILFAINANLATQEANKQAQISRAGELAALALAEKDKHFDLALLFSMEGFNKLNNARTEGTLLTLSDTHPGLLRYLYTNIDFSIRSVAFSTDGKILASGSRDNTIILWDVSNPRLATKRTTLSAHTAGIESVAFSPDGKTLASGSDDKTVVLWDINNLNTPTKRATLSGHMDAVTSVVFSPDGKTLASSSCGKLNDENACIQGEIILWDISDPATFTKRATLSGHTALIQSVAFSPDGKTLASSSDDKTIILWDVNNSGAPTQRATLSGHIDAVTSVVFSPDGKTLASGSMDKTIILWNINEREIPQKRVTLSKHSDGIDSLAFSPNGKTLASGSMDKTIILWAISEAGLPTEHATLSGHTANVRSLAFSPDGKTLASGGQDSNIILWDGSNPSPSAQLASLSEHTAAVNNLAVSPDGKTLASGSDDKTVILWNISDPSDPIKLATLSRHTDAVWSVAFSPDGKMLATGGGKDTIILWNIRNLTAPRQIATLPEHTAWVWSVAFSPDGKTLASGNCGKLAEGICTQGEVVLWNVSNPSDPIKLVTLSGHTDSVTSVAFSPDGKTLASGSWDKTIMLWNVSDPGTSTQLATLSGHTDWVNSVAFSPSGKTLASGGWDKTVILWDVSAPSAPRKRATLFGHTDSIASLTFSPSSERLASSSWDKTITLWDISKLSAAAQLVTLSGHTTGVGSIIFSPNGKTLASGSMDGVIILWNVDPKSEAQKTCQQVGRNFTQVEWKQYFPDDTYRKTCEQWPLEPIVAP